MNEEIEYAEMLEIPVSTVNVVRKQRRRKRAEEGGELPAEPTATPPALKDTVIASVNERLREEPTEPAPPTQIEEGGLDFDPVPERIDTVRLYSTGENGEGLHPYDYALNEGGRYATNEKLSKKMRIALGVELGVACALCGAIFLTNIFMPNSAINTFFRAMHTPSEVTVDGRGYADFKLSPVVSELSDAKLTLSSAGVLSFTDECCVYPAADGKVSEVTQAANGLYTVKISHSDTFTGVIDGLDTVYYAVGDEVKANVPVGFTDGEEEVRVTMYSKGELLNCFQLTEENCLAWISTDV